MIRKLLLLVLLAVSPFALRAQTYAVIVGSNIGDGGGNLLAAGKLCFTPGDANGNPLAIRGAGQVTTKPQCVAVASGVITPATSPFQLLNTATAYPTPFCWSASLQTNAGTLPSAGYGCMQMNSSWCSTVNGVYTCDFDNYPPSSPAQAPVAAPSLTGGTFTTGTPGSSVACNVSVAGAVPNYALNCAIPQGLPGATGQTGPAGPPATFTGAWSSSTAYSIGQAVSFNGASFVALAANTNVQPPTGCTSNSTWGVLACQGLGGVNGLTSDGSNGIKVQASETIGNGLEEWYDCTNTAADGTAIAAFFAQGPNVDLHIMGTCLDTATSIINMQSYSVLEGDETAVLVYQPSGSPGYPVPTTSGFLQNIASQAGPYKSAADVATVAGSNVVNSATMNFSTTDEQQGITCTNVLYTPGSGPTIPNTYSTMIRYVNSATQAVLVDPIPLSGNGVSCSLYNRDSHITLKGLKIENNGPGCTPASANYNWWGTFFASVNGLTIEDVSFQDGTTGTVSTNGCKSLEIADASNVTLTNTGFATWYLYEDGIDFTGPIDDVTDVAGHGGTGDDFRSIDSSQNPYVTGQPFKQGPVHNYSFIGAKAGAGEHAIVFYGIDGVPALNLTNLNVRDLHCRESGGNPNGGAGGGAVYGVGLRFGNSDNVVIDGVSGDCQTSAELDQNVNHLVLRNISQDAPGFAGERLAYFRQNTIGNGDTYTYGNVLFDNLQWNGPVLQSCLICFDGTGTVNNFTISNSSLTGYYSLGTIPFQFNASSIGTLTLQNDNIQFVSGGTSNNDVFRVGPLNGSSTTTSLGTLNLVSTNAYVASGTSGPYPLVGLYNMTSSVNVNMIDSSVLSATLGTAGVLLSSSANSSLTNYIPTFYFVNDAVNNITGCVNGNGKYVLNGNNVQSFGFTVGTVSSPTECPLSSNYITNPNFAGSSATFNAPTTAYDKFSLAPLAGVNFSTLTTASTGGVGGQLADNQQYFYRVTASNSVGQVLSNLEKSVTVCPVATYPSGCGNASTNTLLWTAVPGAQSYNVYRGTTSGGELLCSTLSGLSPNVAGTNVQDTGVTCSGAAVPTTNTSYPWIVAPQFVSSTSNPTIAASTGAGTGATVSITGNNLSGYINLTTGTTPTLAAQVANITFNPPLPVAPGACTLTAGSAPGATYLSQVYTLAPTTTGWTITNGTTALPASTGTITWRYHCN